MLVCAFAAFPAYAQQRPQEPLTNTSVLKLVRAGFKEKTIIAIIHGRPNTFKLDPDRLIELKHGGVSENIILAMLSQDDAVFAAADDWSDDQFFKSRNGSEKNPENPQSGGTDIFGSSGGGKGQTRSRGANGSNEVNSQTTGTATVRILRPPAEEGSGAAPKLEKTPTLNNDSIVKLVDAGFSEGTIVKRIEDSPADFDLSPARLSELRKHRVSESVMTAMAAAMADESSSKATSVKSKEN